MSSIIDINNIKPDHEGYVKLKGILITQDEQLCLVDNGENPKLVYKLDPKAYWYNLLLDEVPCRIGGRYLYEEDAVVEGNIKQSRFTEVFEINITQDDDEYTLTVG